MVAAGEITSFAICVRQNSVQIKTYGYKVVEEVMLLQEVMNILKPAFYGLNDISYNSFEYMTFKRLINTHMRKKGNIAQSGNVKSNY